MAAHLLSPGEAIAPYWQVARRSFQRHATYRGATVAAIVVGTVFGFLRAFILLAVYQQRTTIGSFDAVDAVTFAFVSQGFLPTVNVFGAMELSDRIRTGDVATDLYRPLHFQSYWLADDLGRFAFQGLTRGVAPVAFGALFFTLRLPSDATTWVLFLVALVLAELISFTLRFLVALIGFWVLDNRGFVQLGGLILQFFGGVIVPITFFPHGLERLARLLPFQAVVQLPVEVFLGRHRSVGALAPQLLWVAVLVVAGNRLAATAMRKVTVQGG